MTILKARELLRYGVVVTGVSIGTLLLIELAAWLLVPGRYDNPPAVTADAWIHSDALTPVDTVWMKEYVDEFCSSYKAHWVSYVYYRRDPFSGKHITIDTNGIRFTPQRDTGNSRKGLRRTRIFLLGGSTMWGTGARDSGTIAAALSRAIASDTSLGPVEITNMGESGYVSTQAIIRLELELRKGNVPDIVILYDGVNDIFSAYQNHAPGLPQNELHRVTEFNLLVDGRRMRHLGLKDILSRTVTAELTRGIRGALSSPAPSPMPPAGIAGDIVRMYRGNLQIVEALSKQFGFHYEAYWQPVVFSKNRPSPYEQTQSDTMRYIRPLFLDVYRLVGQDSTLQAQPGFHNISGIFDTATLPVYIDFCHIAESGNTIIARKIFTDIQSVVRPAVPF